MKKSSNHANNGDFSSGNIHKRMEYLFTAGPLILDRLTKRASTSMGMELYLNDDEFDILDLLASRENDYVSFEEIYKAVWSKQGIKYCIEKARIKIDAVLLNISEKGSGFMWIEYIPEAGYKFKTHWGHNWNTKQKKNPHNVEFRIVDRPAVA